MSLTRLAGKLEGSVPDQHAALAVHGEAARGQAQQRRRRFGKEVQEAHSAKTFFIISRTWSGASEWFQPTQNSVSSWQASVT